jgi:hypothetical protein
LGLVQNIYTFCSRVEVAKLGLDGRLFILASSWVLSNLEWILNVSVTVRLSVKTLLFVTGHTLFFFFLYSNVGQTLLIGERNVPVVLHDTVDEVLGKESIFLENAVQSETLLI